MGKCYTLSAPDCDAHYFEGAPQSAFCPECDSYIGADEFVPILNLPNCKLDFCYTYDGRLLVSDRAKVHLSQHCSTALNFIAVNRARTYYVLNVESPIAFDAVRRKTRFEKRCVVCGNFQSIVGATPTFIREPEKLDEMGVYRTDLCFGSGREKSPILVVGAAMKEGLAGQFTELEFKEVNPRSKQVTRGPR